MADATGFAFSKYKIGKNDFAIIGTHVEKTDTTFRG
jgi:hypothetical protein